MQETSTPTTVKRKPGRPPKKKEEGRNLNGVPLPEQTTKLSASQDFLSDKKAEGPRIPPGMSGKCFEIMIYRKEGESNTVFVRPATFGPYWIRREAKVIVPEEVVEALNSANSSTIPISDWDNPREDWSIPLIDVPFIRFPFQVLRECSWTDYISFKSAQASKPTNPTKGR